MTSYPVSLPTVYRPFRVDLGHLMENIKEQYVHLSIEEAVIVENVDNCIDERYVEIRFTLKDKTLQILMIGDGMGRRVFWQTLPKIAATTKVAKKVRSGLGRYGWGMKVCMCVADYIVIETKKSGFHAAQSWKLIGGVPKYKKETIKRGINKDFTLISIKLDENYVKRIKSDFVKKTLQNFYPTTLSGAPVLNRYGKKRKMKIFLNSRRVKGPSPVECEKKKPLRVKVGKQTATGYVCLAEEELDKEERGISIIVHGRKIIKDFFGVHGSKDERITGYLHADMLIEEVAGDKALIRRGAYKWRKLSERVAKQLGSFMEQIGAIRKERLAKEIIRHVHEELNRLIRFFPELQELAKKAGISISRGVLVPKKEGDVLTTMVEGSERTRGLEHGLGGGGFGVPTSPGDESTKAPSGEIGEKRAIRKKRRRGLSIVARPEPKMKKEAWFSPEGVVIINSRFPTYTKAKEMGNACLKYHMDRCAIEALLNHALKNGIVKEEEATEYRNEVFAKWGEL